MRVDLLANHPHFVATVADWYFSEWGGFPGNSLEATIARISAKIRTAGPPTHVIAHDGDEVFGIAQWKLFEMEQYPSLEHWLGSLFVSPQHRGNGIGRELSQAVANLAKAHGVTQIYLHTRALDGGLYSRLGWIPYDRAVSRGDDVLVMVRAL